MGEYTIRPKGALQSQEVDLDDGASGGIYHLDLVETDWGKAEQPEPQEELHGQGSTVYLPLDEAWKRRAIHLVGAVECVSFYEKQYRISRMRQLLQGSRTLRRQGWEIDVFGTGFMERDASKKSHQVLEYEVLLLASPPFWRHVYALKDIVYGSHLYPDFGVPMGEAQPAYLFGRDLPGAQAIAANPGAGVSHLTLNNWGTAFCYPTAAITGGPPYTDIYFEGLGRLRVKVRTDGAGAANLLETGRLYLPPGDNPIRLEDAAGTAINLTSYPTMRIDFGATRLREL